MPNLSNWLIILEQVDQMDQSNKVRVQIPYRLLGRSHFRSIQNAFTQFLSVGKEQLEQGIDFETFRQLIEFCELRQDQTKRINLLISDGEREFKMYSGLFKYITFEVTNKAQIQDENEIGFNLVFSMDK